MPKTDNAAATVTESLVNVNDASTVAPSDEPVKMVTDALASSDDGDAKEMKKMTVKTEPADDDMQVDEKPSATSTEGVATDNINTTSGAAMATNATNSESSPGAFAPGNETASGVSGDAMSNAMVVIGKSATTEASTSSGATKRAAADVDDENHSTTSSAVDSASYHLRCCHRRRRRRRQHYHHCSCHCSIL